MSLCRKIPPGRCTENENTGVRRLHQSELLRTDQKKAERQMRRTGSGRSALQNSKLCSSASTKTMSSDGSATNSSRCSRQSTRRRKNPSKQDCRNWKRRSMPCGKTQPPSNAFSTPQKVHRHQGTDAGDPPHVHPEDRHPRTGTDAHEKRASADRHLLSVSRKPRRRG